jgi:hypothetical protein
MPDFRRRLARAEAALASQQPEEAGASLEARMERGGVLYHHLVNGGPAPDGMTAEELESGRQLLELLRGSDFPVLAAAEPDGAVAVAEPDTDDGSVSSTGTAAPSRPEDRGSFGLHAYGTPRPRTPGRPVLTSHGI